MRKNLIIVRAGDDSCHPSWIDPGTPRDFDILVSYYGKTQDRFRNEAEHYHAERGPRWPAHHRICQEQWDIVGSYDYVGFVCDDVLAPQSVWNRLFSVCRQYNLDLAQPAIDGHTSLDITQPTKFCVLRYTNFVEIMCPVFGRAALEQVRGTFQESVSGWGLDFIWGKLLPYPQYKVAILDSVRVCHTRPQGGAALAPVLAALGVDPLEEMERLKARYGLGEVLAAEHARVCQGFIGRLHARLSGWKLAPNS